MDLSLKVSMVYSGSSSVPSLPGWRLAVVDRVTLADSRRRNARRGSAIRKGSAQDKVGTAKSRCWPDQV
jgi:hypothetical protein